MFMKITKPLGKEGEIRSDVVGIHFESLTKKDVEISLQEQVFRT